MSNNLGFFAIHADDLPRTQRFYEKVFGWKFTPWGPPGFFLIQTGEKNDPGVPAPCKSATNWCRGSASTASSAQSTLKTSTRRPRP